MSVHSCCFSVIELQRNGFEVVACSSGDEAVRKFDEHSDLDIVVSDLVMPGDIQGSDLLAELRSRGWGIPFLAMSGYADLKDGSGSAAIGEADAFLEKPFDLTTFSDEIGRLLRKGSSSD